MGLGWLDSYGLRFHKNGRDGSGKADAFYTGVATDRLYGRLFEISPAQKHELDGFEGPGYRCDRLSVSTPTGSIDAWIYIAKPEQTDFNLIPFDWYHQLVEQGARVAGFPREYIRQIEEIGFKSDPDLNRARRHFSMLSTVTNSKQPPDSR